MVPPFPLATVLPSGAIATAWTEPLCPLRVTHSWPVNTSQSFTVPSSQAEANVFPSGKKATDRMVAVCPLSEACKLPLAASQIFRLPYRPPVARYLPLGENANAQSHSAVALNRK